MKKKYETGSNHLHRKPFFNQNDELDIDIPDGDIKLGEKLFTVHCSAYTLSQ
jgi:hypothetical protein